jgi:hypothetical protein
MLHPRPVPADTPGLQTATRHHAACVPVQRPERAACVWGRPLPQQRRQYALLHRLIYLSLALTAQPLQQQQQDQERKVVSSCPVHATFKAGRPAGAAESSSCDRPMQPRTWLLTDAHMCMCMSMSALTHTCAHKA